MYRSDWRILISIVSVGLVVFEIFKYIKSEVPNDKFVTLKQATYRILAK